MTNFVLTARVTVALFTNTSELPDPNGIEMVKTVTVTQRETLHYTVDGAPRVAVKEFEKSHAITRTPIEVRPTPPMLVPKPQRRQ